ncbi:diphthine--ammonia ligase [Rutidosis leptorrhynchoides]|uniref:diphthine--ammonia ligase n=1 Tax=Rutidosis leptorrhynchoides TaxID=125765 RepID=UPI003A994AED
MKVVALVSGGKDSCYAMMKCIQYGHQVVALANLLPSDDSVDELDSYMYQTVGHQIIVSIAECMGLPLFRRRIKGSSRHQELSYKLTPGDEVEDLFILLKEVKRQIPTVNAVSSGAIASDYQRLRVESVCSRLGLVSLAYLWRQDQSLLLQEMITNEIVAITVKVAAIGLDPAKHLGKELESLNSYLHKLKELYGINVCGEGGEYETLTLDCPLFVNARIVLDKFEVVLHSSDSIAPVGVLHPLEFHLENKVSIESGGCDTLNGVCEGNKGFVFEVHADSVERCETTYPSIADATEVVPEEITDDRIHISKTNKDDTFSICCWLEDTSKTSTALQEDLELVLKKVESQLKRHGFSWEHVLYVHLYIADMNDFTKANDTYVSFITQDKCPFGVPSRSTIELPLLQVGLGKAYIEVLVTNDQSKRVLHVQSISSWAPSCIGPYSQATLHKEILYMAGQLGLDPPTMTLCNGGPTAELEQALKNSEAVARTYKRSISTSVILFVVYCSTNIPPSERFKIQEGMNTYLKQTRLSLDKRSVSKNLSPMFLYVLVPDLPKRAFVEVKPMLYVEEDGDTADEVAQVVSSIKLSDHWEFQSEEWHDSCIQKCILNEKICAAILCITREVASKICSKTLAADQIMVDNQNSLTEGQLGNISRFCIYLLDKILIENFMWKDIMNLRLYFPAKIGLPTEKLSLIFSNALKEVGENVHNDETPIFNLVPVLACGSSAASMDDIITCELFARKS